MFKKIKSSIQELAFLTRPGLSYLVYWVTQNCNFSCDHCFNFEENKKKNQDLTLDEIEKVAISLHPLKYLTIAGGEPFLRQDLSKIVDLFCRHSRLEILNIVTNGWFEERVLEFLKEVTHQHPDLFIQLAISIDGDEAAHDKLRQKKGSYKRAISTLERALEWIQKTKRTQDQVGVVICGTYHAENALTISEFADDVMNRYQVPFVMNMIRGDFVQNQNLKNINVDHYKETYKYIQHKMKSYFSKGFPFRAVRLALLEHVTDVIYQSAKNGKMTVPCQAGRRATVLTASGDILLCEILKNNLGNLRNFDYNIYQILKTTESQEKINKIVQSRCHCTWECFQSVNVVHSSRAYPSILRKTFRYLRS